jgi:DNA polymerase III subunit beta
MVSTDGSRLSKYDIIMDKDSKLPGGESVLIPKKGLHEISKFLDSGDSVQLALQGSYFVVQSTIEKIYIRLLEGMYPKYEEIIFREEGNQIELEKDQFLNMLKRMSILCNDNYRAAMFTFDADLLMINATNPDIGDSREDMNISFKGGKIEAAFNPKFFIDAANCINDKRIILNLLSMDKPCLIEGIEDKSFLGAVMPMRV